MNRNLKTEIAGLYVTIVILVIALALMTGAARAQVSDAMVRGAKIGIAADSPDSYRTVEVRGACEDVFTADECIQCHEF